METDYVIAEKKEEFCYQEPAGSQKIATILGGDQTLR
jgi:hypothetical protein